MRIGTLTGAVMASCLLAAVPARADLMPGSYEMTTTVNVPGVQQPQTATQNQCITAANAKDPAAHMLHEMTANGQCAVGQHTTTGQHLVADFSCNMQGHQTAGHLDVTFSEQAIDGTIAMRVNADGQAPQQVTTTIKAVRKGNCS